MSIADIVIIVLFAAGVAIYAGYRFRHRHEKKTCAHCGGCRGCTHEKKTDSHYIPNAENPHTKDRCAQTRRTYDTDGDE